MKNILISAFCILFSAPVLAKDYSLDSLSAQCYSAEEKMINEMQSSSDALCKKYLSGYQFRLTGDSLMNGNISDAKLHIAYEIEHIKYAEAMECEQIDLINWALNLAEDIKAKLFGMTS